MTKQAGRQVDEKTATLKDKRQEEQKTERQTDRIPVVSLCAFLNNSHFRKQLQPT